MTKLRTALKAKRPFPSKGAALSSDPMKAFTRITLDTGFPYQLRNADYKALRKAPIVTGIVPVHDFVQA